MSNQAKVDQGDSLAGHDAPEQQTADNTVSQLKKVRVQWTAELKATVFLIMTEIDDVEPYSLRTDVFNDIYSDYLAATGHPEGVQYGVMITQYRNRVSVDKSMKASWMDAMAVVQSEKGADHTRKVKETAAEYRLQAQRDISNE
ncbi:hypothetical protein LTR56_006967 [Elasticomyces elasticus]|nr:hypothetical protein LTR22_021518 [Elasticomyces elasticus]KAK3649491.1 hypothetical protein LTR56_006967 [Elasticomyces elasticus]KAK4916985.1 hypothetical protein LTR49_015022 [Elasticomyces elasticus]KAK5749002.1 hypothetical protein LTS12_020967 [Elasticomyces elasticus]